MSQKIRKIQVNPGYFHAFLSLKSQKTPKDLRSFLPVTTDMGNENAFRLGKRAVRLIKEGNFELGAWEEIYDKVDNAELLSLVSSMRNALGYGLEKKAIRMSLLRGIGLRLSRAGLSVCLSGFLFCVLGLMLGYMMYFTQVCVILVM